MTEITRLAAEAANAEADVQTPSRAWAGSVVSNLVALKPGNSYVHNLEVVDDEPITTEQMKLSLKLVKARLRRTIGPAIKRAKEVKPDLELTTETSTFCTDTGRMFACVIITRTGVPETITEDDDDL